jgi:hypothetical protein
VYSPAPTLDNPLEETALMAENYLPQHKKLAMTGELGQELPASKTGATGKPSTEQNNSALMGGGSKGSDTTLGSKGKSAARSPW